MLSITPDISKQQKNFCLKLLPLMFICLFISWITELFLIKVALDKINIYLDYNYFWLTFIPMLFILAGLLINRAITFDWMALYIMCLPMSFLYITFSVIGSIAYLPSPINWYAAGWMLITFLITFIVRAKDVDFKHIKKNLLKYYIDKKQGFYAPKIEKGDIGNLYKKDKYDNLFDKIKAVVYSIIIYVGPLLIGYSMSSAGDENIKMLGGVVLFYLLSTSGGIYMFLLYYARLRCLYQIQKELGCKLKFG
jgi:hypothetical protein